MNDKYKRANFAKAVDNLKIILRETATPIVRDAAIKRYELCYELAWKAIQEALRNEGLEVCKSPKNCFQQAFQQGWITDEETFAEMITKRNLTIHIIRVIRFKTVHRRVGLHFANPTYAC